MSVDVSALEQRIREYAAERINDLADAFVNTVREHAPRRTGELADSVTAESPSTSGNTMTVTIVVGADYGRYVNDGTGIYGPDGVPIVAKHRRRNGAPGVLVFDWAAAGGIVFTTEVAGMEATHFWERSIDAWPAVVASL